MSITKDINDMTIEKRAEKYADNYVVGDAAIIVDIVHKVAKEAYIAGATEQEAVDEQYFKSKLKSIIKLAQDPTICNERKEMEILAMLSIIKED